MKKRDMKKKTQAKSKSKVGAKRKPAGKPQKKPTRKRLGEKIAKDLPSVPLGRPLLLDKDKIQAIAQHIEDGNFAVTACALEGITERTFYYWLDAAERDEREGKASLYVDFFQSIKKASAIAEAKCVRSVLDAGMGWQAYMTWLERRFPDRWGHQMKLSLDDARSFVRRLMSVLASHIPDRDLLAKIVQEIQTIKVEKHDRPGLT